jgi:hypothetical protein
MRKAPLTFGVRETGESKCEKKHYGKSHIEARS